MNNYDLPLAERIKNAREDRERRERGEYVEPRVATRDGLPRDEHGNVDIFAGTTEYNAWVGEDK